MSTDGESLLQRVASSIAASGATTSAQGRKSILSQAATSFAKRPSGAESTIPTGFDPRAAVLFEAVVEAAFLVANSDGEFDEAERQTFEAVVSQACQNTVRSAALHALVNDLCNRLNRDGMERRVQAVGGAVHSADHKLEVLRIGALMAHISGGVADPERAALDLLAKGLGLEPDSVQAALDRAERALKGA